MSKKRNSAALASDDSASASISASATPSSAASSSPADKKQKLSATTSSATSPAKLTRGASLTNNNAASSSSSSEVNHNALTPAAYSTLAASHAARFKTYTATTTTRASTILHEILPRKVLELDHLVSTPLVQTGFEHSVVIPFTEDGTFVQGREKDTIPSNPSVMKFIDLLKPEILQLIAHLGELKLMIQLRIPAVDDGNNFGVEIQEESISEITKAEDVEFQQLERIQAYIGNRTRVAAKISKYAAILDYWQALRELDESFYTDLRLHALEIRNTYATVHDLLRKNEEKIHNPRGDGDQDAKSRRHAFA